MKINFIRPLSPFVDDNLSEDNSVLHEGEEDQEHAGQQPHLQRRHRVGDWDSCPDVHEL